MAFELSGKIVQINKDDPKALIGVFVVAVYDTQGNALEINPNVPAGFSKTSYVVGPKSNTFTLSDLPNLAEGYILSLRATMTGTDYMIKIPGGKDTHEETLPIFSLDRVEEIGPGSSSYEPIELSRANEEEIVAAYSKGPSNRFEILKHLASYCQREKKPNLPSVGKVAEIALEFRCLR